MASDDSETNSINESCPLLRDQPALESQKHEKSTPTPIPKLQLAALCSFRIVDPIAFSQIFPYINEFMNDLHVTDDPSDIGFYSGLVESAFAFSQLLSIYQWARFSDVVGRRRPILISGTLGIAITSIAFGLSQSLHHAIIARFLCGFFSGTVAVIHSVLGEITDSSNQAVAFPIYGLFWPLGSIIGPLLGGTFSNPATKYPKLFDYDFLRTFPYFLPCFFSGLISLFGSILGYLFLDETHPSRRRSRTDSSSSYASAGRSDEISRPVEVPGIRALLSIPVIRALCSSGAALSFTCTAFDVVFVLFCYSPIKSGGLAFSASQIGFSLAMSGVIASCVQLLIMPTLLRTFDTAKMYKFCMTIWPFTFTMLPFLNLIAHSGFSENTSLVDSQHMAMLWVGVAFTLTLSRIAILSYSLSMMIVKDSSPNPESLGASHGIVQFAMCCSRAFSPAFVSSCFALSLDYNLLGGYLWVVIMVLISFLGSRLTNGILKHRNTPVK